MLHLWWGVVSRRCLRDYCTMFGFIRKWLYDDDEAASRLLELLSLYSRSELPRIAERSNSEW